MKRSCAAAAIAITLATTGAAHAGTLVFAANSGTTDLGVFAAGTYNISATGLVSLSGAVGSGGFDIRPDGVPDTPVTAAGYGYFNPSGSDQADGIYGVGGPGIKIGALMGAFAPVAPQGDNAPWLPGYFFIGYGADIVHAGGHIYAQVNDTFYSNDQGAFDVTVRPLQTGGVPEPQTWALLLLGFYGLGSALRLRPRPQLR